MSFNMTKYFMGEYLGHSQGQGLKTTSMNLLLRRWILIPF